MSQLVSHQDKVKTIRTVINQRMPFLRSVIQRGIDPERFAKIAVTVIAKSDKLPDCSQTSLLGCLMQSAQLGLDLDPALGLAYMVPFKGVATFITGYKGLMELARRSNQVSRIVARTVYENDDFDYEEGTNDFIHHKPARGERGALTHVYAVAHLIPPGVIEMMRTSRGARILWEPGPNNTESRVLSVADVEKFRARSRMGDGGAWKSDYEAMAMKTAVRRLATWIPQSPQLARALQLEEQADTSEQDFTDVIDLQPEAQAEAAPTSLDQLAQKLPAPAREPGEEG